VCYRGKDADVDLSDVDDYSSLSHIEKTMLMLDAVREEYGCVSMDDICTAELHAMYWAIARRKRLQSIHSARSMKRDHSLSRDGGSGESLARRGVFDADAAREWFKNCGIPVVDAIL
jgi:hypothetical protein